MKKFRGPMGCAPGRDMGTPKKVVLQNLIAKDSPHLEKLVLPEEKGQLLKSNLNRILSESDRFLLVVRFSWAFLK